MASNELLRAVASYEEYIRRKGIDEQAVNAYTEAVRTAFLAEKDIQYGLILSERCKNLINDLIYKSTQGGNFKALEEWAQANKQEVSLINQYYDILLAEAPYSIDSFKLYIERDRRRQDRFYEPRRKTLLKISNAIQRLENDELDILFFHQPPRTGKLLADDTPVFTSNGWKNHGDLVVGDKVIGSDGKFTEIVKVFPKDYADYKVTLTNGDTFYCHGNHEWTVYDRRIQKVRTFEVKHMFGRERILEGKVRCKFLLPLRNPMEGTEKYFDLHPYVLGAWLGDGTNTKPWITDPIEDYPIIEKIVSYGYSLRKVYTHKITGVKSFVFDSILMKHLQKYDMCYYDKTCEKHIPEEYLTASLEQRMELLAGLLDTDGSLNKKEHRYHFSTINERLKDDFVTLINTFGWRASVTVEKPHTSSFGIVGKHDCYIISFNPTFEIPCVLDRKHLSEFSKQRRIGIWKIEKCDPVRGNCISVSNEDGLYAVGKTMQLTHNSGDITMDVSWHCARDAEKSNLYVTYKEGLGGAFLDGVKEIYQDPTYRFADVFPHVKIVDTDAKNNKLDLNRKKKYKTLSGKGLESGLNGEYDATGWLVIDDPLEGVQDVLSKEVLKRKQTIFDNNVLSRKKENCKLILLGTLWATNDLYGNYLEFLETHDTGSRYDIISIPALNENDESNFEYDYGVGYSTKYFLTTRAKFEMNNDIAGWNAQYQQKPIDRDGTVFNPDQMNFYRKLPDKKPLKIISHCDVALGGEDFLAMPVVYYYENDDGELEGYVEDVVYDSSEKHITKPQVIAKIKKHKIRNAHFESNQGGEGYKDEVKAELIADKNYKEPCNITSSWASSAKSKEQRIWDNAQDIRQLYYKDTSLQDKQYRMFMQNLYSFTMIHKKRFQDGAPDSLAGLVEFERYGSGVTTAKILPSPI